MWSGSAWGAVPTGMPALIVDRWVDEKTRWLPSLAALKRRATRTERVSESPSCIVYLEVMSLETRGGAEVRRSGRGTVSAYQSTPMFRSIGRGSTGSTDLYTKNRKNKINAHREDYRIDRIFMPNTIR